jgi:cytokinin dehydrogenase
VAPHIRRVFPMSPLNAETFVYASSDSEIKIVDRTTMAEQTVDQTADPTVDQTADQTEIALNEVRQDFGHILCGAASAIARPTKNAEVISIIKMASSAGLVITPRGKGFSQSGQSVSLDGITLDMSNFNQLSLSEADRSVTCGAGLSWRQILMATVAHGYLPCVMPLNLNLTLGGTLAVGGIGSNSHQYGSSVANVLAVDVITGNGDFIHCSPTAHPDLFQAVLSGQGRCAVIVAATLKLRPLYPRIVTCQLLYTSLEDWLSDQQILSQDAKIAHIEGFCLATAPGQWRYKLIFAIEFDRQVDELIQDYLKILNYAEILGENLHNVTDFLARYDSRFKVMQQTGDWQKAHPWFECFLPLSQAPQLIREILATLPSCFGDGHRVIPINTQSNPQFLMTPGGEEKTVLFAALPTGIDAQFIPAARSAIKQLNRKIMQAGGKRYLSGWLEDTSNQFWQQHFGDRYADWIKAKHQYDTKQVFGSLLFQGDPVIPH